MKRSTLGGTLGVLLAFSVISYARIIQRQEPKPVTIPQPVVLDVAGQVPESREVVAVVSTGPAVLPPTARTSTEKTAIPDFVVAPQTYTATAYSLRGRTASGLLVSRGLIAADPAVLPLGTRVRVEAGEFSGEYVVADTGGAVRGRRIDIWTPTSREAMRFGRRAVKLTVLQFGGRRNRQTATRPRLTNAAAPTIIPTTPTANQPPK
jgi:3D (Asp-Asp-Asp) domain-containing protein